MTLASFRNLIFPISKASVPSPTYTLTALEGSIGYSIGGARVEVEVGYERFVIKGGKKSNEDTASVFLLGKELAYDTARGQVDRLTNALGKMTKSEAKKWGTAVEGATGGDALSRKVCGTANSGSGTNKCGTADSQSTNGKLSTAFNADADATLLSAAGDTISTSGMATNINGLTKDEKAIVAGAFARAVEGAEEIGRWDKDLGSGDWKISVSGSNRVGMTQCCG
ncbi:P44/Msp2 family outer membrane protein [Anaplasma ovis]|uniref:P44/Msp2 family outer membrane protein n=1 Tax=Anaplasma ovis TaxID=142058 RepID=UPI0023B8F20D|nr:P44/Msp2 family outer membrane protein [Anaplasma ovis]